MKKKVKIMVSLMLSIAFAMAMLGCEDSNTDAAAGISFDIPAPTGLRVSAESHSDVSAYWTPADSTRYDMRYTINGGAQELITSAEADGESITGLKRGDTVQVWVRAVTAYKEGSDATKIVTMEEVGDVTGVALTGSTASTITVKWNEVANNSGYKVYYLMDGTSEASTESEEFYNHTGTIRNLLPSKKYNIQVAAFNGFGESTRSPVQFTTTTALSAPVIVLDAYETSISVNWNSVGGATHYNLYWSIDHEDLGAVKATVKKDYYNIERLLPNKEYSIKVEAINEFTAEVGTPAVNKVFTKADAIVEEPAFVSLIPKTTGFTVKWGKVTDATKYNIYYSSQLVEGEDWNARFVPSPKYKKGSVGNTDTYNLTGLNPGEYYYVYVTALKDTEESSFTSAEETTKLYTPTELFATKTDSGTILKWMPVGGADVWYSWARNSTNVDPGYGYIRIFETWDGDKLVVNTSDSTTGFYFIKANITGYNAGDNSPDLSRDIESDAAVSLEVTYP